MIGLLAEIGPAWTWVVTGLVLAGGELLAPGIFLIWLGLACLGTGLLVALIAPSWPLQAMLFAALAIVFALLGRRLTRFPISTLNQRGHNLVGREFVIDTPILDGVGRLRFGDTSWRMTGPDLAAGSRVKVVALDGATLVVVAI